MLVLPLLMCACAAHRFVSYRDVECEYGWYPSAKAQWVCLVRTHPRACVAWLGVACVRCASDDGLARCLRVLLLSQRTLPLHSEAQL